MRRGGLLGLALLLGPSLGGQIAPTGEAHLHSRIEARLGRASAGSLLRGAEGAWLKDLNLTVRPLFEGRIGSARWIFDLEAVGSTGDTRERLAGLATEPAERDLLDLARITSAGRRHRQAVRVDRLALVLAPRWGAVTIGRQAVTWGGGLVFNPFDLFNPFAPAEVVRDFKTGADLLHLDIPLRDGELQGLAVGRRDPASGKASARASSFALQGKRRFGVVEGTLMGALHHDEPVLGAGLAGPLGGATWRVEGTWMRVRPEAPGAATDDGVSVVANLQFAWRWLDRNTYGLAEYHFNGFGGPADAATRSRPVFATLFARGNAFVLGRHLGAASIQMEWHPLLTLAAGAIVNLEDGSLLVQPRFTWDATSRFRMTAGIDLPVGPDGTEFGGHGLPGTGLSTRPARTLYVITTWDF